MTIKTKPEQIWHEYTNGTEFKASINLYDVVKQNNDFYHGNQWEGVNAPNLTKAIVPMTKRVVSYLIATLVSNDMAVAVNVPGNSDPKAEMDMQILQQEIERVLEINNMSSQNRDCVRNAAVDGDACVHLFFNPKVKANNYTGEIEIEVIDNTNVIFGNPNVHNKEKQPYIILVSRVFEETAKDMARENGIPESEVRLIQPEDAQPENVYEGLVTENRKVTILTKYFRNENDTISVLQCTHNARIMPEKDTGMSQYPIAYFSWEKIKNCYHGQAVLTNFIPNQRYVNLALALAMKYQEEMAFPKLIYDMTKLPEWNNESNSIGVVGNPRDVVFSNATPAEMSTQLIALIDKVIQYTVDFLGASDAALGKVNPENTSAIIATQRATAVPLQLQKIGYRQFVEDYVRAMVEIMKNYYGVRRSFVRNTEGQSATIAEFDYSSLSLYDMMIRVDVGEGAYWDEYMQTQQLDNMFARGIIPDPVTYLESLPQRMVPNKAVLIKRNQDAMQRLQQLQQAQPPPGGVPDLPSAPPETQQIRI